MAEHFHAVIWMDHRDAKIIRFSATQADSVTLHSHQHAHPGSGAKVVDKDFYARIVACVEHNGAILLTGPGTAKTEFKHYLSSHHVPVEQRISAVETLDHPSEGVLVAHARHFFRADDRLHSQRG